MATAHPLPDEFPAGISPALSQLQRLADTFTAPTRAFTDLRRNASWWLPYLVLLLGSVAFSLTVQNQVGWDKVYEGILRESPKQQEQFANMPAGQAASAKAVGRKFTAGFTYGVPVIILVAATVVTAVLMATLNFGFGGKAKFAQMFALYMYASVPVALKTLLTIIALFAGLSGDSFSIQNPVGTNVGYYLPTDTPKWLMALATSLDVFTLWQMVLLVIGCAILARISRSMAAVAVVGWWILFVGAKVAGAAFNS